MGVAVFPMVVWVSLLIFIVLPIVFQVFLSKRENSKLGRIPSIVYLIFSVLSLVATLFHPDSMSGGLLLTMYFGLFSIILLILNSVFRRETGNRRRNSEIDKTNILDL